MAEPVIPAPVQTEAAAAESPAEETKSSLIDNDDFKIPVFLTQK